MGPRAERHYKPIEGRMRFYANGHGYFVVGEKFRYPAVFHGSRSAWLRRHTMRPSTTSASYIGSASGSRRTIQTPTTKTGARRSRNTARFGMLSSRASTQKNARHLRDCCPIAQGLRTASGIGGSTDAPERPHDPATVTESYPDRKSSGQNCYDAQYRAEFAGW